MDYVKIRHPELGDREAVVTADSVPEWATAGWELVGDAEPASPIQVVEPAAAPSPAPAKKTATPATTKE